jgi:AcrR family transcriptional regulator
MASDRTRDKILNVAEVLFADRGFHGVSVREIADAAGVRQSLIHYHFANKDNLYVAVYGRRSSPINAERVARLRAILDGTGRPALRDIASALVAPALRASRNRASGGIFYARLITQIINDPQGHARKISRTFNDPMARQMIEGLGRALPKARDVELTWGYLFAIGAMTTALGSTGRAKRLNRGCSPNDVAQTLDYLETFIEGGMRALAEKPPRKPARRRLSVSLRAKRSNPDC